MESPTQNHVRRVFLVGAPRSGTTWLQLLLAQHENIVTCSETHIFTHYLSAVFDRWDHELARQEQGFKVSGLTQVLSEKEFLQAVRVFVDSVLDTIANRNDGASLFLEKTPEHLLHWQKISAVYPDAKFIHIVRDPRAVVSSFANAANTWWSWTQSGPIEVTKRWRDNIRAGERLAATTDGYYEIRYESLLNDGENALAELFEWLGLNASRDQVVRMLETCRIENLRSASGYVSEPWSLSSEPDGFFRKGKVDSWRGELSKKDVALVEKFAGDEMSRLGYQRSQKMITAAFIQRVLHSVVRSALAIFDRSSHATRRRIKKLLYKL